MIKKKKNYPFLAGRLWEDKSRFRKELIEELMKNYDVVLSMPFVGHHEDFINMGLRCIETKMERRGVNPIHDFLLMKFYKKYYRKKTLIW